MQGGGWCRAWMSAAKQLREACSRVQLSESLTTCTACSQPDAVSHFVRLQRSHRTSCPPGSCCLTIISKQQGSQCDGHAAACRGAGRLTVTLQPGLPAEGPVPLR